jgi:rod shape-determining protein MreC
MVFGQLLLIAGNAREGLVTSTARGATGAISRPVVAVERSLSGILVGFVHLFRDLHADETERVKLQQEVTRLSGELERRHALDVENDRLRRLLGMREDLAPRSIGASVVTLRLTDQSRVVVIDRGSSAGVRPDMAVVAWGGAVGRVVSVERDFSRVRLLTDPGSGAAGVILRTGAAGMVVGRGGGAMDMLYVPKYDDVALGDRVVSSGVDGVFPRGFGLGRVSVVGEPLGASKTIHVEPEIDERALEDVLVLLEPRGTTLLSGDEPASQP